MTRYGVTLAPWAVRREIKCRWMLKTPAKYVPSYTVIGFAACDLATKSRIEIYYVVAIPGNFEFVTL